MSSTRRINLLILLSFLLAGPLFAVAASAAPPFGVSTSAASPLVSANPNKVVCGTTTPPLEMIANNSNVNANSYHINSQCKLNAVLSFPSYNKPKIISDDAKNQLANILNWIDLVASEEEHYEHHDVPLGDCALAGQIIDGLEDFPQDSKDVLDRLGIYASPLSANGTLTQDGSEFYWDGEEVTLMGFSWPGALTSLNFNIEGFLDVLALKGVNLTRVFAIEQWTALATGCERPKDCPDSGINTDHCPSESPRLCTYAAAGDGCKNVILGNGHTPFTGSLFSQWDLSELNPLYFSRMIRFVEAAAARGIVVQLSLFERNALKKEVHSRAYGWWLGNPYNQDNNTNGFLPTGPDNPKPPEGNTLPPPEFLGQDGTDVGDVNSCFIGAVAQQLSPYGNVILEIMNEPKVISGVWSENDLTSWHAWVEGKARGGGCSNRPPHAEDDGGFSTPPNTSLDIPFSSLLANDIDPDPGDTVAGPFYQIPQLTMMGGTLTWGNPFSVKYTPPPGFTGMDTFDYIITDRLDPECCRLFDVGTVTINVAGIVGPPATL